MDKLNTQDHLANQQWLLNHGFINNLHKDNLHGFGSLVHKDIGAVYTKINHESKKVEYTVYVTSKLLHKMSRYKVLRDKTSIYGMWKFKRFLQKEGNLNFNTIINVFVQDYCGGDWSAVLEILDIKDYRDDLDHEQMESEANNSSGSDKPSDG